MTYHQYYRCYSCSGRAQASSVNLMKYVLNKYPYARSLGIYNCRDARGSNTLSIHACGRALDIGIPVLSTGKANTTLGNPIVQFLDKYAHEFGLMGQIYNRIRYDQDDPNGAYYGGVHPHYDHDHVEQIPNFPLTYEKIVQIAGPPTATPIPGDDEVEQVYKDLQQGLKDAGYYTGTIDGAWGPLSKAAYSAMCKDAKKVGTPGPVGPAGPAGPRGPVGPAGPVGPKGPTPKSATFVY